MIFAYTFVGCLAVAAAFIAGTRTGEVAVLERQVHAERFEAKAARERLETCLIKGRR